MKLAQRIASTHPMVFTAAFVVGGVCSFILQSEPSSFEGDVIAAVAFLTLGMSSLWLWSIYSLADGEVPTSRRWSVAYLAAPLGWFLSDLLFRHQVVDRESPVGALLWLAEMSLLIACTWKSAEALEMALGGKGVRTARIGRTAALMFFWIVGVWVLRTQVLTIVARSRSTSDHANVG